MDASLSLTPEKIKEIRAKKNLSQEAFAKLLGVSASTVIRWEQGTAQPTGTAATVLMAMLSGPFLMPITIGAIAALPWAFSAYGIYQSLKDVFESGDNKPRGENNRSEDGNSRPES